MSQSSEARWGRWITIGGLLLLTKGVEMALPGLTRVARDEVFLRGGDAVLLLEPSAFGPSPSTKIRVTKSNKSALNRRKGRERVPVHVAHSRRIRANRPTRAARR